MLETTGALGRCPVGSGRVGRVPYITPAQSSPHNKAVKQRPGKGINPQQDQISGAPKRYCKIQEKIDLSREKIDNETQPPSSSRDPLCPLSLRRQPLPAAAIGLPAPVTHGGGNPGRGDAFTGPLCQPTRDSLRVGQGAPGLASCLHGCGTAAAENKTIKWMKTSEPVSRQL